MQATGSLLCETSSKLYSGVAVVPKFSFTFSFSRFQGKHVFGFAFSSACTVHHYLKVTRIQTHLKMTTRDTN